jgi:hypothetical protein
MTHRGRAASRWVAAAVVAAGLTTGLNRAGAGALVQEAEGGAVTISVLSTRADLVSGGDALIEVALPAGAEGAGLQVTAGERDVTPSFTARSATGVRGVVDQLPVGPTTIEARLPDGRGARLTVTNHPRGGPVLAGPQVVPWICTTAANGLGPPTDAQCNAPARTTYQYQPSGAPAGEYQPYDPAKPPTDVATTRTVRGGAVPYILRVETGTIDRSIYRTMVLADPRSPWTAVAPQPTWNGKVLVSFAGGCGTPYQQQPPPARGPVFGNTASDGDIVQPALLGQGWMTATAGALSFNQSCNPLVSAETVMMLKEHIIDTAGPIERTISVGGSGGSVQQHYIATAYPGLLDGIVPTQSFPDLEGMTWDTADCALGTRYFLGAALLWVDLDDQLAVLGKDGPVSCLQFVTFFGDWFDPQNRGPFQIGAGVRTGCSLPSGAAYHPTTNPTGARCSVQDYQRSVWGTEGPRNAAPLPFDNVGVQYGLEALEAGAISPAQFVDLNARIGGIDNEGRYTPGRSAMSPETAAAMYRANLTTDVHRLAELPILDVRDALVDQLAETLSDMHQPYNTRTMRARLDTVNGTHANHVVWFPVPENLDIRAVRAVDRWIDAIRADTSSRSAAEKVIANRPADLVDTCWIDGRAETDATRCRAAYPGVANAGNARLAAGAPLTDDIRKCALQPLDRGDYRVRFTDRQWAALQATFPEGVCDWTRPGVGQQPGIPWLTYAAGPGGQPLGPAPVSQPFAERGRDGPAPAPGRDLPALPATGADAGPLLVVGTLALAGSLALLRLRRC